MTDIDGPGGPIMTTLLVCGDHLCRGTMRLTRDRTSLVFEQVLHLYHEFARLWALKT